MFSFTVLLMKCYTQVQEVALRSMPDIVVATPGRIIDHLRNSLSVGLEDLAVVILDEADRLLELGFSAEIQELVTVELWFCLFVFVLAWLFWYSSFKQVLELVLRFLVFLCFLNCKCMKYFYS